jgi:hypothetical protein
LKTYNVLIDPYKAPQGYGVRVVPASSPAASDKPAHYVTGPGLLRVMTKFGFTPGTQTQIMANLTANENQKIEAVSLSDEVAAEF